jgi:hypothetical protein
LEFEGLCVWSDSRLKARYRKTAVDLNVRWAGISRAMNIGKTSGSISNVIPDTDSMEEFG